MPESSKFDVHKAQLVTSLSAVADSMRNCAKMADMFAKIMQDTEYFPETAEAPHEGESTTKGKRKAALSPEDGDASKKRKRPVKPKDPNAPKRPASSYILFQNEVRKELKERHPDLTNADLLALISEQWKSMSDEQKEESCTYNQAMKTAKAQYSEDKKAYDSRTPEQVDAANAAVAAAVSLKKASAKPRAPKAVATPAPVTIEARPPPLVASDTSSSSDSEEDEAPQIKQRVHESDSSDEEEEEEEEEEDEPAPPPKKKRGVSGQTASKDKDKKGSKAR